MDRYLEDPAADENVRAIGESIASWRKIHRLTQEQLAARAGVSRPVVTRLERGEDGVGIGALMRVAAILGIDDRLTQAVDPMETRFGRELAERTTVARVRRAKR